MPLVYQQNINATTKIAVWHIAEPEAFFLGSVSLQRNITHPHKRLQHLAGRLLLKELYPDFPYELIRIADTRKPFLENEAYHFSISHCGDYAAVIVSTDHRVGVDIELVNDKVEKVKHKFLSEEEQLVINDVVKINPGMNASFFVTLSWSIKESMFKWYGTGAVDFINHMEIKKIELIDNIGIAHCRMTREGIIELPVHFLCFNNNAVSWILT